jgi:hypothetical protein
MDEIERLAFRPKVRVLFLAVLRNGEFRSASPVFDAAGTTGDAGVWDGRWLMGCGPI